MTERERMRDKKELADKARNFKEDEKGAAAMCKVMEDMRNERAMLFCHTLKRNTAIEMENRRILTEG